jgi:hypothetical protein
VHTGTVCFCVCVRAMFVYAMTVLSYAFPGILVSDIKSGITESLAVRLVATELTVVWKGGWGVRSTYGCVGFW